MEMQTDRKSWRDWVLAGPSVLLPWAAGLAAVSYPFFAAVDVSLWSGFCFFLLLLFPAAEDALSGYISDGWSLALAVPGVSRTLWLFGWEPLWGMAAVLALLGVLYIASKGAMGDGDVFLGTAIASWFPGSLALLFLWTAFAAGGLIGAAALAAGRKSLKEGLPFGPFLAVAGAGTFCFGERLAAWYAAFF